MFLSSRGVSVGCGFTRRFPFSDVQTSTAYHKREKNTNDGPTHTSWVVRGTVMHHLYLHECVTSWTLKKPTKRKSNEIEPSLPCQITCEFSGGPSESQYQTAQTTGATASDRSVVRTLSYKTARMSASQHLKRTRTRTRTRTHTHTHTHSPLAKGTVNIEE